MTDARGTTGARGRGHPAHPALTDALDACQEHVRTQQALLRHAAARAAAAHDDACANALLPLAAQLDQLTAALRHARRRLALLPDRSADPTPHPSAVRGSTPGAHAPQDLVAPLTITTGPADPAGAAPVRLTVAGRIDVFAAEWWTPSAAGYRRGRRLILRWSSVLTNASGGRRSRRVVRAVAVAVPLTPVSALIGVPGARAEEPDDPAAVQPCPADAAQITAETTAAALSLAQRCRQQVQVEASTSETTQEWALPSGQLRREVSVAPVRVRSGDGWAPVDLTLVQQPDGSVTAKAHPDGLTLSGATTQAGVHELATVGAGDEQVAMGWTGALPAPVLAANTATYPEVKPGVDLVVEATPTGVESFYVVKTPTAAQQVQTLTVPIAGEDVASHRLTAAGLTLLDDDKNVVASSPAPLMWDARTDPVTGEPTERRAMHTAATPRPATDTSATADAIEGAGVNLTITPDAGFLAAPDTVYPVTIDPQLTLDDPTWDTWVRQNVNEDLSTREYLEIGNRDGLAARSFVNFDVSGFKGAQITDASVAFYNWRSGTCGSTSWELWSVTGSNTSTRWTSQPTWTAREATSTATKGGPNACVPVGFVWVKGISFFQRFADSYANVGYMGIRATDETAAASNKLFYSQNYPDTAKSPYAVVTYKPGPQITGRGTDPTSNCTTGTNRPSVASVTPIFWATASDETGPTTGGATFEWQTLDGVPVGSDSVTGTELGQKMGVIVPQDTMDSGQSYRWRVRATADAASRMPWSSWCEFTIHARLVGPGDTSSSDGTYQAPLTDPLPDDQQPADSIPGVQPVTPDGDELPTTQTQPEEVEDTTDEATEPDEPEATISSTDPEIPAPATAAMTTMSAGEDSCPTGAPTTGSDTQMCQRPATADEAAQIDAVDQQRLATSEGTVDTAGYSPTSPRLCWGPIGQWRIKRYEACLKNDYSINVWDRGRWIGTILLAVYRYTRMQSVSNTFDYRLYFEVTATVGNTAGTIVEMHRSNCSRSCTDRRVSQRGYIGSKASKARLGITVTVNNLARMDRETLFGSITFAPRHILFAPLGVRTIDSNWVRCDNAMRTVNSKGCVVPNYVPTLSYPLSGPRPTLARHILNAQNSELPGRPSCPTGVQNGACTGYNALNRIYDPAQIKANRDRACPQWLRNLRPPGKSCDEYPMATTRQGAMSAPTGDSWRTFKGCQMGTKSLRGRSGWSRCFIDATENRDGGFIELNQFVGNSRSTGQRILNGDPYFVATP